MKKEIFVVSLKTNGKTLYNKGNLWRDVETTWTSNPNFATSYFTKSEARLRIKTLKSEGFPELQTRKIITITELVDV